MKPQGPRPAHSTLPQGNIMTMLTMVDDQEEDGYDDDEDHDQGHDALYDHDYDHDLGHDYDNGCDLDHLQDVDISKGRDGDDDYDDDDENDDDNGDVILILRGPLDHIKKILGQSVR